MANNVTVQVIGGTPQVLNDVATIADLKAKLGLMSHSASINGEAAADSESLEDYNFVTLSASVKGGV